MLEGGFWDLNARGNYRIQVYLSFVQHKPKIACIMKVIFEILFDIKISFKDSKSV